MLRFTLRLFNWIERLLFGQIVQYFGCLYLAATGVSFGKGLRLYGLPAAYRYRNSRIVLGDHVTLRSRSKGNAVGVNHEVIFTTLREGAIIEIGNRVGISGGAICAKSRVVIGDDALIGANVVIADNDFHPVDPVARRNRDSDDAAKDVVIGNNVWIGTDSYICKGVSIGENSVIGAKSVVTKSIPKNCIAAGIPARVVKLVSNTEASIGNCSPIAKAE